MALAAVVLFVGVEFKVESFVGWIDCEIANIYLFTKTNNKTKIKLRND